MNRRVDEKAAAMRMHIQKVEKGSEKPPEWRTVPGVPFVEACSDGRLRFVRELPSVGMVDAQLDGARVRASASTLHHAAWPELWPRATGAAPRIELERRPKTGARSSSKSAAVTPRRVRSRPFQGLEQALATAEVDETAQPSEIAEPATPKKLKIGKGLFAAMKGVARRPLTAEEEAAFDAEEAREEEEARLMAEADAALRKHLRD